MILKLFKSEISSLEGKINNDILYVFLVRVDYNKKCCIFFY